MGNMDFTPGGGNGGQMLNVDITTLDNFRCPHCNNQVFQPLFIAKKISAIQSKAGKAGLAPLQIYACTECGAVPAEFGGNLLEKPEVTKDEK